jgi:hypothetical protein
MGDTSVTFSSFAFRRLLPLKSFDLQRPNQAVAARNRYAYPAFWIAQVISWAQFIMQQDKAESRKNDRQMISIGCAS